MIKAGINIRNAMDGIAEQISNTKFRGIMYQVKADVEAGQPFSEALAKLSQHVFSPAVHQHGAGVGTVRHLRARCWNAWPSTWTSEVETRSMVIGAMVYPCIIGVMAVVTTVFLLTFVLPSSCRCSRARSSTCRR